MNADFKTATRNAWCDCIRGYAILLVCLSHVFYVEPLHVRLEVVTHYFKGDTGVFMFYVLSGFLVTGILLREVEGQARFVGRLRAMGHFFARRIFRLQPSYLLFLILYAVLSTKQDSLSWWVLLFPLSNWFAGPYITWHLKTLHIEESYYLFIGMCSGVFQRRLRPLLWGLLAVGPLGRVTLVAASKFGSKSAPWLLDRYLPVEAFAIGGLLVLYLEQIQNFRSVKLIMRKPATSFAAAMFALLVIAALRPVKPFSYALTLTWPLLFSICSAVLILSGLGQKRFFFSGEWLRKLGLASYTVYLFQQFPLGPWNSNFGLEFSWARWSIVFGSLLVLVPLWYALVEKPVTDLGARWFPRVGRRPRLPEPEGQNLVAPPVGNVS